MAKIDIELPLARSSADLGAHPDGRQEVQALVVHVTVYTGDDARFITGKVTPVLRIPGRSPNLMLDRGLLLEILRIMEREIL